MINCYKNDKSKRRLHIFLTLIHNTYTDRSEANMIEKQSFLCPTAFIFHAPSFRCDVFQV